jgi:hypothetical protein
MYMKWRVVASITGAERMRCWARVLSFTEMVSNESRR